MNNLSYEPGVKITDQLAILYNCSPKSVAKLANLMSESRRALKLGNGKRLTDKQCRSIWRYHAKKVGVIIPKPSNSLSVNIPIAEPVKKPSVKAVDGIYKLINFGLKVGDKRTVISLERYIADKLSERFSLSSNSDVRKWIQTNAANDIDLNQPLMRQIRHNIIEHLVTTSL